MYCIDQHIDQDNHTCLHISELIESTIEAPLGEDILICLMKLYEICFVCQPDWYWMTIGPVEDDLDNLCSYQL